MTNKKSKTKKRIILLIVLVLLAAVAAVAYVPVSSYLAARYAPAKELELPSISEIAQTAPMADLTTEDINKLISGEASLDALLSGTAESEASSANSSQSAESEAASQTASDAESEAASQSADSAASSQSAGSAASLPASSSTTQAASSQAASSSGGTAAASGSGSSEAAASSEQQTAAYEDEIKALILQLYAVQASAESGLNACIEEAKAEFHALPEDQQTQARKISITFSKIGTLSALQASCDKEVESIVSQMRTVLTENGQDTSLADQAMETYKSQKSARYNELMAKLYS